MARSFGEIAFGVFQGKATRAFQPVRRNSYYAQDRRATALWRPLAPNKQKARELIAMRMKAAEFYDRRHKEAGKRNGPLGHVALEVLRELYRLVDYKTGRLDPAIATICEAIKRSKQAVVDALKRLKEHGFLDWVRRSQPINDAEGAGPRVRQISNAYGFSLPQYAAAWVARKSGKGPAPDCELARAAAAATEFEAMLDQTPLAEQAQVLIGNPELAEIFARLGALLSKKERESTEHEETSPEEN
jgi:DNA-binding MarR family transcriptional regulator